MFDIVLNFAGIFGNCFGSNRNYNDNLSQLKKALFRADKKTKIQLLLAKITDHKFHSCFLFQFTSETTFNITDFYGEEQHQVDSQLLCRNVPIMFHNKIVSVLCVRSKKLKKITVRQELIDLLTQVVISD